MDAPFSRELVISDLKQIPLLAHLTEAELARVARAVQERRYENGETIFAEGNPCVGMYILKTGRVKLLRSSKQKEQLLALVKAGEPLDLVPLLDGGPHTFSAKARGPISLYLIDSPTVTELIWSIPPLLNAVLNAVSARLRYLCALTTDLAFKDVTMRVSQILLEMARTDGEQRRDGIHLKRTLSQSELAALAGTAREVLWRSLKKLEAGGLIRVERDEITLLDPDRLAKMI